MSAIQVAVASNDPLKIIDSVLEAKNLDASPWVPEVSNHQRILDAEARWARRFGVAQLSIREALNILASEGFVTKRPGRSARVLSLTESDIIHIYQEFVLSRLPVFKRPHWVEFLPELPKTATGKIQRFELRAGVNE